MIKRKLFICTPFRFAVFLIIVDIAYLSLLHVLRLVIYTLHDSGVNVDMVWDAVIRMNQIWFQLHIPLSRFLQQFFPEIWSSHHPSFLLVLLYEALCVIQTLVIGYAAGVMLKVSGVWKSTFR